MICYDNKYNDALFSQGRVLSMTARGKAGGGGKGGERLGCSVWPVPKNRYIWPNSVIFPTLFMTGRITWYSIFDQDLKS